MLLLELLCLAIVAIHVTVAALRARAPASFLRRVGLVALAAWLAEDTCIRLYGFYAYHPGWFPFIDRMPLMVALIWPGVILSAWELADRLSGTGIRAERAPARVRRVSLAAAALVVADASFMEPLAVRAELWSWSEPGLFGVPPIGVLGWGFFSGTCVALLHSNDARGRPGWADLWVVPLAPAATHLLLLSTWWGLARWVSGPLPAAAAVVAAWAASLVLTTLALARRAHRRIPLGAMATRIPAALFFFALLGIYGREDGYLLAYALAFAPPYLVLTLGRRHPADPVGH